jgi:L-ascorbate metabolism protein UlaG (beta-lactamase superfamily)
MTEPIRFTLIGGPTLLVEVGGLRLLTDPTFDEPGSYPGAVTLEKRTGPALAPAALGRVDAVLLSHDQHADNLDRAGRAFLASAGRVVTTREGASRLGRGEGLAPWEQTVLGLPGEPSLVVTATPARHGPPGIEPLAGAVTGFVVSEPGGRDLVYLTGDTVWFEGTAEVARRFRPAVVVVFAGRAQTRGPFHLTMDGNDALEVAQAFPAARLLGIHNEGWAHFTESAEDLEAAFRALGQRERLLVLERGRSVELAPLDQGA